MNVVRFDWRATTAGALEKKVLGQVARRAQFVEPFASVPCCRATSAPVNSVKQELPGLVTKMRHELAGIHTFFGRLDRRRLVPASEELRWVPSARCELEELGAFAGAAVQGAWATDDASEV